MSSVANPAPQRQTDRWVSLSAVAWALDYAPDVPAPLLSTLIAVARYADVDGRGAHPSAKTVAKATRKSERQAKRDIADLRKLGLLLSGDPAVVAHIHPEQRPAVYDLPLHLGRPESGSDTDDPSVIHDTGVTGDTREVSPTAPGGCHAGSDPVTPVTPKEPSKNPKKNPQNPSLSQATTPDSLLAELGADERERDELIQKIKNECQPQTLGWWITASRNGTLLGHLEAHRAGGSTGSGMPAWCGTCDKDTRQIEAEDQYGGGTRPHRCPDCHPSVVRQPPPARRQNGGWGGPHLNSTDPHAFDGYKPHARENVNAHQPCRDKPARDYRAPL